jgi:lactobin A/cerein 7B family class IIb bacteriocin
MENLELKELSNDELMNIDGGIPAAAGVAIAIGGFAAGVIIGAAVAYGTYCLIMYLADK